jgi:hypothetical protein
MGIKIGFTPNECEILHLIFTKHEILTDWGQLPKLLATKGEMSQIGNKLLSGALMTELEP